MDIKNFYYHCGTGKLVKLFNRINCFILTLLAFVLLISSSASNANATTLIHTFDTNHTYTGDDSNEIDKLIKDNPINGSIAISDNRKLTIEELLTIEYIDLLGENSEIDIIALNGDISGIINGAGIVNINSNYINTNTNFGDGTTSVGNVNINSGEFTNQNASFIDSLNIASGAKVILNSNVFGTIRGEGSVDINQTTDNAATYFGNSTQSIQTVNINSGTYTNQNISYIDELNVTETAEINLKDELNGTIKGEGSINVNSSYDSANTHFGTNTESLNEVTANYDLILQNTAYIDNISLASNVSLDLNGSNSVIGTISGYGVVNVNNNHNDDTFFGLESDNLKELNVNNTVISIYKDVYADDINLNGTSSALTVVGGSDRNITGNILGNGILRVNTNAGNAAFKNTTTITGNIGSQTQSLSNVNIVQNQELSVQGSLYTDNIRMENDTILNIQSNTSIQDKINSFGAQSTEDLAIESLNIIRLHSFSLGTGSSTLNIRKNSVLFADLTKTNNPANLNINFLSENEDRPVFAVRFDGIKANNNALTNNINVQSNTALILDILNETKIKNGDLITIANGNYNKNSNAILELVYNLNNVTFQIVSNSSNLILEAIVEEIPSSGDPIVDQIQEWVSSDSDDQRIIAEIYQDLSSTEKVRATNDMSAETSGAAVSMSTKSVTQTMTNIQTRLSEVRISMINNKLNRDDNVLVAYNEASVLNRYTYFPERTTDITTVSSPSFFERFKGINKVKNVWGEMFSSVMNVDGNSSIPGYETDTYGFTVGCDDEYLPNNRTGVSYSYAISDTETDNTISSSDKVDTTSHTISLYNMYTNLDKNYYIESAISGTLHKYNQTRSIAFAGAEAKADYEGKQYSVQLGTGYDIVMLKKSREKINERIYNFIVTPNASLLYSKLSVDGYTETGADSLNLAVDSFDYDVLTSRVGVTIEGHKVLKNNWSLQKSLNLNINYDLKNDAPKTISRLVETNTVSTQQGNSPEKIKYEIGANIKFIKNDKFDLGARYNFEFNSEMQAHTTKLQGSYKF